MTATHQHMLISLFASVVITASPVLADGNKHHDHADKHDAHFGHDHSGYTTGVPSTPSNAWTLSAGGRIYDTWWEALGTKKPTSTHPAWPKSNTNKSGAVTWRCKSCHGWDYRGSAGQYASGSYATAIKGVQSAIGANPDDLVKVFTDKLHAFTDAMIPADAKQRLAKFLAMGQHDTSKYISKEGKVNGNAQRGSGIFQNVCAACHNFDGKAINWGDDDAPAYVGTEANANPWEVLHKIRNGHPGHNMVSLRAFPMADAVDVLAHAQTLPKK